MLNVIIIFGINSGKNATKIEYFFSIDLDIIIYYRYKEKNYYTNAYIYSLIKNNNYYKYGEKGYIV